jgi:hypothetical protein
MAKVEPTIRNSGTHSNKPITSKSGKPPKTLETLRVTFRRIRSNFPRRSAR